MADCKSVSVWVFQDSHVQSWFLWHQLMFTCWVSRNVLSGEVPWNPTNLHLEITVRLKRSCQNKFLQRKKPSHFSGWRITTTKNHGFSLPKMFRWVYGELSGYFNQIQDWWILIYNLSQQCLPENHWWCAVNRGVNLDQLSFRSQTLLAFLGPSIRVLSKTCG